MIKLQLVTFLLFLSWNPLFGQFNKPWETYKEEDDLDPEENKILNVDLHTWQQHFNEKQKLLVVFCKSLLFLSGLFFVIINDITTVSINHIFVFGLDIK